MPQILVSEMERLSKLSALHPSRRIEVIEASRDSDDLVEMIENRLQDRHAETADAVHSVWCAGCGSNPAGASGFCTDCGVQDSLVKSSRAAHEVVRDVSSISLVKKKNDGVGLVMKGSHTSFEAAYVMVCSFPLSVSRDLHITTGDALVWSFCFRCCDATI